MRRHGEVVAKWSNYGGAIHAHRRPPSAAFDFGIELARKTGLNLLVSALCRRVMGSQISMPGAATIEALQSNGAVLVKGVFAENFGDADLMPRLAISSLNGIGDFTVLRRRRLLQAIAALSHLQVRF